MWGMICPVLEEIIEGGRRPEPEVDLKVLHANIGQLTLENDFLEGALTKSAWTAKVPGETTSLWSGCGAA